MFTFTSRKSTCRQFPRIRCLSADASGKVEAEVAKCSARTNYHSSRFNTLTFKPNLLSINQLQSISPSNSSTLTPSFPSKTFGFPLSHSHSNYSSNTTPLWHVHTSSSNWRIPRFSQPKYPQCISYLSTVLAVNSPRTIVRANWPLAKTYLNLNFLHKDDRVLLAIFWGTSILALNIFKCLICKIQI